jgi:hypothetical protein
MGANAKILGRAIAQAAVTCETACTIETTGRYSASPPSTSPSMSPTPTCYASCVDANNDGVSTGETLICPQKASEPYLVYCDQDTDNGGGWMLTHAYNHAAGENKLLVPETISSRPRDGLQPRHC